MNGLEYESDSAEVSEGNLSVNSFDEYFAPHFVEDFEQSFQEDFEDDLEEDYAVSGASISSIDQNTYQCDYKFVSELNFHFLNT